MNISLAVDQVLRPQEDSTLVVKLAYPNWYIRSTISFEMDFMSTIFPDRLRIGDMMYSIDSHPLEPFLDALPRRPEKRSTINTLFGYIATWESFEGRLYLVDFNREPHLQLFAKASGPIVASWFSGIVCAWRGESRETGYPPRKFWNEQIVLDIVNGEVVREWVLDLRSLPNQTGAELEQSLPAFLMKPK